jgi:hypothetical protein
MERWSKAMQGITRERKDGEMEEHMSAVGRGGKAQQRSLLKVAMLEMKEGNGLPRQRPSSIESQSTPTRQAGGKERLEDLAMDLPLT